MLDLGNRPCADHHVGPVLKHRLSEQRYVGGYILVVGVGVDDDIGAEPQARVDAGHEGVGEAAIAGMAHDMVDAVRARHLGGVVGAAIVNNQPFDAVETGD